MPRNFWQEEVGAVGNPVGPGNLQMPLDLTVDPSNAANPQYPADWVEMTGGGTLTYIDGSGETQTLTSTAVGYVMRSAGGFHKLVSLSGASPNQVRCGTGLGPTISADASASSSAAAAASSATAAASSATTATTQASAAATSATNAGTSATAAAASAALAAAQEMAPSATVIMADPGPAVIGTFYDADPSGGAFNFTLPAIGSGNHGKRIGINVVTTSAHAITPVPNGTDTLPANLATVSGTYGRAVLMADNGVSPKAWRLYST